MGRRKKKKGTRQKERTFPVTPQFKDRNLTSVDKLTRKGKTLQNPFAALQGKRIMSSWRDDCIPNILWACILTSFLEREDYLALFRAIVGNVRENLQCRKQTHLTHNFLSTLNEQDFDLLMKPVLNHPTAISYLRGLRLVDSLPDRAHWDRHIADPDPEKDANILIHAVADTFDHQSQRSTDIRWLKLMYMAICREQVFFPSDDADSLVEELRLYPNKGDMRSVRPSIRAMEISFRGMELGADEFKRTGEDADPQLPPFHGEAFWKEMLERTQCIPSDEPKLPKAGNKELMDEVLGVLQALDRHFFETTQTTATDPRHDGAFGFAFYALTLLFNSVHGYVHGRPEGRIVLRTLAEACISMHYLTSKDDATLWEKYRRYGAGQAKLAFLKNLRDVDTPDYLDMNTMEALANEDMWMEFEDINLGNWVTTDLRRISEEVGCKAIYDKYYDWTSCFSHSHWAAVRDTVFVNCLNPLHRYHRIPAFPKQSMPTILVDGCKLCNLVLDDLSHLYPSFKPRLKWHKQKHPTDVTVKEEEIVGAVAADEVEEASTEEASGGEG